MKGFPVMDQEKKENTNTQEKKDKTKVVIAVLAILLVISLFALAKIVAKDGLFSDDDNYVEVGASDNLISSEDDLSNDNGNDSTVDNDESDGGNNTADADGLSYSGNTGTPVKLNTSDKKSDETNDASNANRPDADSVGTNSAAADNSEPADIVFSNKNSEDAEPFVMSNMFPGDRKTKDYIVQVSYHDSVTVHFKAELHEGSEKLAEVMRIRVTLPTSGETLYDGLMKDMDESVKYVLTSQNPTTQDLTYEVRVSLSTSVGNEYQNKSLEADFKWWIEESDEDNLDKEPGKLPGILPGIFGDGDDSNSDIDGENADGEDGQGILGKTGDDSNIVLWALIAVIAVGVCVVINRSHRKDRKDNDKEKEDKPNV